MKTASLIPLLAMVALTAACEAQVGTNDGEVDVEAAAKSEAGKVSIKAPGVDIQVDIPEGIRANVSSDGDMLYPGSTMSGIAIAGNEGDGAVELRFTAADAPERVAAWYRDPSRADFTINAESREGAGFVFNGAQKDDGTPFKLRLTPRDGGTEGVLSILDRD